VAAFELKAHRGQPTHTVYQLHHRILEPWQGYVSGTERADSHTQRTPAQRIWCQVKGIFLLVSTNTFTAQPGQLTGPSAYDQQVENWLINWSTDDVTKLSRHSAASNYIWERSSCGIAKFTAQSYTNGDFVGQSCSYNLDLIRAERQSGHDLSNQVVLMGWFLIHFWQCLAIWEKKL